jgi:signal transduction histidine kinase
VTPALDRNNDGTARAVPADPRTQQLADAMRKLASAAAEQANGGVCLVFAATPGEESTAVAARLRAAAGFGSPQAARDAAQMLLRDVQNAIASQSRESLPPLPSLGQRAAHMLEIHPLAFGDRTHGALVIGFPSPPDAARRSALETTIGQLGLWLDHQWLSVDRDRALAGSSESSVPRDDQSEEILKLSEALFAQDIELLRSNEKIGKIEKLKNDFIEKMSRELRTPLNSIIEGIIAVLTGENDQLSESAKQTLRSALDEGSAFLRTLQNILDLWRIKRAG